MVVLELELASVSIDVRTEEGAKQAFPFFLLLLAVDVDVVVMCSLSVRKEGLCYVRFSLPRPSSTELFFSALLFLHLTSSSLRFLGLDSHCYGDLETKTDMAGCLYMNCVDNVQPNSFFLKSTAVAKIDTSTNTSRASSRVSWSF